MDVREKLVELLDEAEEWADHKCDELDCETCYAGKMKGNCVQKLMVDRLIDHGVTVQEWISVKDRLPKYTEEEMEKYRFFGGTFFPEFNVMILGAIKPTTLYYDGERWYDEEGRCYYVTHWQPMPQPPKGDSNG